MFILCNRDYESYQEEKSSILLLKFHKNEINSLTKIGMNTFWYYISGDSPMCRRKRDSQTLTNEIQPGE